MYAIQCIAPSGCKRKTSSENGLCHQHQNVPVLSASDKPAANADFGALQNKKYCQHQGCISTTVRPSGFCFSHDKSSFLFGRQKPKIDHAKLAKEREAQKRANNDKLADLDAMVNINYQSDIAGSESVNRSTVSNHVLMNCGFSPRDEQLDMTVNIIDNLKTHDRTQLRAACGMGKTLVQQMAISEYNDRIEEPGTYVVIAPTIALAKQLRESYEEQGITGSTHDDMFSVHHDANDKEGASEKVDEEELRRFLNRKSKNPKIIFVVGTDTSIGKVIEAQKDTDTKVDMTIFDEAHKYTISSESKQVNRALFDTEDGLTLKSKTRVFMTATPDSRIRGAQDDTVKMTREEVISRYKKTAQATANNKPIPLHDRFSLNQSNAIAFGPSAGSYSFSYAVKKGYLVPPNVQGFTARITTDGANVSRNTRVGVDGRVVDRETGLNIGAYQNIVSMYENMASDDAYNIGRRSNVLSFINAVPEIEMVEQNWRSVGETYARSLNGGMLMTDEEATRHAYDPESPKRRAARVHLLAKNASLVGSSSDKHNQKQRDYALKHFDMKGEKLSANGTPKGCECGQPGRWCPCARVVVNYNMFSEGIDIASVDTVIMDRPRESSEQMIYQAIGRSSRKYTDYNGNKKPYGTVVIPMTCDEEGNIINSREQYVHMATIDKVWNDRGTEDFRSHDGDGSLEIKIDGKVSGTIADSDERLFTDAGFDNLKDALITAQIIDKAFNSTWSKLNRENPSYKNKREFTMEQRYNLVMNYARAEQVSAKRSGIDPIQILSRTRLTYSQYRDLNEIAKYVERGASSRRIFDGNDRLMSQISVADSAYKTMKPSEVNKHLQSVGYLPET